MEGKWYMFKIFNFYFKLRKLPNFSPFTVVSGSVIMAFIVAIKLAALVLKFMSPDMTIPIPDLNPFKSDCVYTEKENQN